MGEVYQARDTRLGRTVAIKILSPALAGDVGFRDRFDREARAVSQLNHPHICTLYDVGDPVPSAGTPGYLVMEFCDGETLSERLARGPLPLEQALTYAAQMTDALDKAHRTGIVHRDLKPANVMVTKTGVKLLDFGLAEQRVTPLEPGWSDAATRLVPLAPPGALLGTLHYLAPEQIEARQADERTDIFACGAVIYEMVTGRKAFSGDTQAAVIAAIMSQAPPPLRSLRPDAPAALEFAVDTCLAKDPDRRWQNAGDLARYLTWLAAAPPPPPAAVRPAPRPAVWVIAAAVFALAAVGVLAALWWPTPADAPVYRTSIVLPPGLRFPGAGPIGGVGRFALSPDGRRITFVSVDSVGNQMLWVRPLDSLTATPIAGTEGAASPFWSPDSRSIGFVAQGQLKTVAVAGGTPVAIATPALNATGAWNADGVILYARNASSPLHRVAATGGPSQPVTRLDAAAGDVLHRNPFFLPDGRRFLYVAVAQRDDAATGPRAVFLGSLDPDVPPRLVIDRGSIAKYSQGSLVFLRDNMLLAQAFDPATATLEGAPRPIAEEVELNGPASAVFSLSDTGVLAYQPAAGQDSELVWVDRAGRQVGTLGDAAQYGDVELSPDGRRAAVSILDPTTNTRDLWIYDVARSVRTRFTFDRGDDVAPAWSPDGNRLYFASNRLGHYDLRVKAAAAVGTDDVLFADDNEKYPTSVLPGGQSLLFWKFGASGTALLHLPLTGTMVPTPYLTAPAGMGRLSPDARWVLYASGESGRSEVYAVRFPTPSRKLQISSAGGSLPRWQGDGREIVYLGRDNRLMSVSVTSGDDDLAAGAPRPLFEARPVGPRSFFDLTRDGERFLINILGGESLSSSITLVQNWDRLAQP
jgi:Tol biopolymer transport system component